MSNIDKRALREAAEKATPGRWEYYPLNTSIEYNVDSMDEDQGSIVYVDSGDFTQKQTDLNGAFIAAANPATVLAVLDELEESERLRLKFQEANCELCQKLEAAEKRIAELEALARGVKQYSEFQICHYGATEDYAKGYIDCQNNYNKVLFAAAGKGEAS